MLATLLPLLCCVIALILDRLFGEPKYHPLVLFGNISSCFERRLNNRQSRINGFFAAAVVMLYLSQGCSICSHFYRVSGCNQD